MLTAHREYLRSRVFSFWAVLLCSFYALRASAGQAAWAEARSDARDPSILSGSSQFLVLRLTRWYRRISLPRLALTVPMLLLFEMGGCGLARVEDTDGGNNDHAAEN